MGNSDACIKHKKVYNDLVILSSKKGEPFCYNSKKLKSFYDCSKKCRYIQSVHKFGFLFVFVMRKKKSENKKVLK